MGEIEDVMPRQHEWIAHLSELAGRPLRGRYYIFEGGNSGAWVPLSSNQELMIKDRQVLPSEIPLDLDADDWDDIKSEGDKIINFLQTETIPYLLGYTGGKGIHFHTLVKPATVQLFEQEYDGPNVDIRFDAACVIRKFLADWILKGAGVTDAAKVDMLKVKWSKFGNGTLIREFGCPRDDGNHKTLINSIPEDKMEVINAEIVIPSAQDIKFWDLPGDMVRNLHKEIRGLIQTIRKANAEPSVECNGDSAAAPCLQGLLSPVEMVERGSRHERLFFISRLMNALGCPRTEIEGELKGFCDHCENPSEAYQDALSTARDVVTKGIKNFSCQDAKTYGGQCNKKACHLRPEKSSVVVEREERGDQASVLMRIALQDGAAEYFHDERGTPHVKLRGREGGSRIVSIADAGFGEWLAHQYNCQEKRVAGRQALMEVVSTLRGKAKYEGKRQELQLRVGGTEQDIWYDLCDEQGRMVHITNSEWEVVDDGPVLFKRFDHMRSQDLPVRGGMDAIDDIISLLNLRTEQQKIMYKVVLCTAFVPGIAHAVYAISGPPGSAKSTLEKVTKNLIDPSEQDAIALPSKESELIRALDRNYMVPFDNVEHMTKEKSNLLCMAVTGAAMSTRRLYTDDDDYLRRFKRPIMLNGVSPEVKESDLLDRAIMEILTAILADSRRPESEIWAEFITLRASALGEIFDHLSKAMALKLQKKIANLPRLADWFEWGVCLAETFGVEEESFRSIFNSYAGRQHDQALLEDVFGAAIVACFRRECPGGSKKTWIATPRELLKFVTEQSEDLNLANTKSRGWPTNASEMSRRLNKLVKNLAESEGLRVIDSTYGPTNRWLIELRKVDPEVGDFLAGETERERRYKRQDRIKIVTNDPRWLDTETGDETDTSIQRALNVDEASSPA